MRGSFKRQSAIRIARAVFPLWRALRPAIREIDGPGHLLGEENSRRVILIWALDLEDPAERVTALSDVLSIFDLAVIVLDDWPTATKLASLGQTIVLPDHETGKRFHPDADWTLWRERRMAQIRYDWAADFELNLSAQASQAPLQILASG